MIVTAPGDVDFDVTPGTPAHLVLETAGLSRAWCGGRLLAPDHPAGVAPLVHGARLSAAPDAVPVDRDQPWVRVISGPDAGMEAPLTADGITVGRSPDCDLVIDDPAMSARHALITFATHARVRDLRSTNGVAAQSRRRWRPGTTVTLGRTTLLLGPEPPATDSATARTTVQWSAAGAGAVAGITLAAITGRWYLALLGVVGPAAMMAPALVRRWRGEPAAPREFAPPAGPLAVGGEDAAVRGYVRAVLLARGRAPLEEQWREPWTRWLPPGVDGDAIVPIRRAEDAPSWCRTVVTATPTHRLTLSGAHTASEPPLAVSQRTAEARARALAAARAPGALPAQVRWADIAGDPTPARTLPGTARVVKACLGSSADGPLHLDLDADGPHFLVAGTTGAGKSVLLETLVGGLALTHSPADVAFALIDFKGGAALADSAHLPHAAGVLTDLDGALADRAIAALSHELAERKAALRERGLADLLAWERLGGAPPRLVVVIDEYQEIVSRHPGFLPDLARLAAQGRSLGLHLVLATQRPAGAVTPEVRANVSTTIALRVASVAESRDLLGVADAAEISTAHPGRAVVARDGERVAVQVASPVADAGAPVRRTAAPETPGRSLAVAAAERWRGEERAAPLWRAPLPTTWSGGAGIDGRVAVALGDWPAQRRQEPLYWRPQEGPAVVLGPAGSGRTSALRAFAAQAVHATLRPVWLPDDPREAARTLALASTRPDVLVVVDDAQAALTRLADVDDGAALDALMARAGLRLPTAIASAPGLPVRVANGAALCAVLTGTDETARALWGVPRELALTSHGPGRAWVRGPQGWVEAQLAREDSCRSDRLVAPLPRTVMASQAWGVGGDDALPVRAPSGRVAVVGPPGGERERIAASIAAAQVTCHDLPALAPAEADATVLCRPTARALRSLAPASWQGVADPVPVAHRVALIVDGQARAVQLASG